MKLNSFVTSCMFLFSIFLFIALTVHKTKKVLYM